MAMIFDMDGVLVHSMPLHILAWEQYLSALGISIPDLEARMHGKRNSELVRDMIDSSLSDDVVFNHGAGKERLFREMLLELDPVKYRIPGLGGFLERYKDVPKAVATNAEPENLDFILDRFGLRPSFPVTVNGMEVERPKPFPDIYLEAARRMAIAPANCIVFEDSPIGAEAGRAAGMRVIGVETTPTRFEGIDLQIKDFLDPALEPWLQTYLPN
jgi:HAD superfamily hydrolase (TIGR01509 family)